MVRLYGDLTAKGEPLRGPLRKSEPVLTYPRGLSASHMEAESEAQEAQKVSFYRDLQLALFAKVSFYGDRPYCTLVC